MFYELDTDNNNKKSVSQTKQIVDNCDDDNSNHQSVANSTTTNGSKTSKMYHCKICGKKFRNLKSRSAHMKAHIN